MSGVSSKGRGAVSYRQHPPAPPHLVEWRAMPGSSGGEDDLDLYGDVVTEEDANAGVEAARLREKVAVLEAQVAGLRAERKVLVHNMSCLFRTAQDELRRKDVRIADLQGQVDQAHLANSRGRGGPHR